MRKGKDPDPHLWLLDPDPDPRGPKTCPNTASGTVELALQEQNIFYVTDGNIMYLTDDSRFLISCVIQHYAPVVGWGGVEEQMHNVD